MVLNNYWKACQIQNDMYNNGGTCLYKSFGIVEINGNDANINYAGQPSIWDAYIIQNIKIHNVNMTARVGTGTGTIDADDYALFDDCTSSFSDFSVTASTGAVDEGYSSIYTIRGTNNTDNTITLTEAGIAKRFLESGRAELGSSAALFVKVLLDEPIEVPANGTFEIAIQWLER